MRSMLRRLTLSAWVCAVAAAAIRVPEAAAAPCAATFGELVSFKACPAVKLPGLDVTFLGISRPDEKLPVTCRNYEARAGEGASAGFRQCSTGVLGGHATFVVDGRSYTVLFDAARGCARLASGPWAPKDVGEVFYEGALDAEAIAELHRSDAAARQACSARNRK